MINTKLYESQKLALWYFTVAIILFGAQILFGLIAAYQYIDPSFLYNKFSFMTNRTIHVNAMIIWLLMGFMGSVYWFLPIEAEQEVVGIKLGKWAFGAFVGTVAVVVLVLLFVQYGPGNDMTRWFINEGREYLEAPRWADIAIVVVMLVFFYNVVATTWVSRKRTGILGVLIFDLFALATIYLAGMFYTVNLSIDQYFWWWVIHLWVEATWEVMVGVLMAWSLMTLLGTSRRIVESWLYLEVFLVFGTGILGLGHHYFWIGTPSYWLGIGGFFSALEPLPLVAMVVHSIYDAGTHKMRNINQPALFWVITQAFGNFIGGGVWGFMQTLPQINLYTHGTQLSAAHGHLAFFGAYVTANISILYIILQKVRAPKSQTFTSKKWKYAFFGLLIGMLGMAGSLTVSGFTQSMQERAVGGSTWHAFITTQLHPWFTGGINWRFGFGFIFLIGFVFLVWDLLTIGKSPSDTVNPVSTIENENEEVTQ